MDAARHSTLGRRAAFAGLIVAAAAVAWITMRAGDSTHTLRAAFEEAIQIVPGQEVRIAGRKVGRVADVNELDGNAIVDLEIDDADWPLRRGTTARLRYGSLAGYAARFVDLTPGPDSEPPLPEQGVLGAGSTITPVEFDQLFNTFDESARADLRGVLDGAADTVDGRSAAIASAFEDGAGGVDALADLFAELGAQPEALDTLVRAGARTAAALRSREPQLRELVGHAAATFDELAGHARAQQLTLERFPEALRSGRGTLGRLDNSLVGLRGLIGDLAPGARSLSALAPTLERTTATLLDVAPLATDTLEAGARSAPDIDRLLQTATPFLPRLGSALDDLAPMVACIRPYGPEIAGTATTWTGFTGTDIQGGYARANLTQLPPGVAAGTALNSEEITSTYKDKVFYAFPRPPGLDAGQPWFLPQCGAGPDSLDPTKDPELR